MFTYLKYRYDEFMYGGFKIEIPQDALVLDVASGGRPYWRSNVLLDKFVLDDSERDSKIVIDRDFVMGDVNKLPFKDKAFDFVIARHILEHLEQPDLFLKELGRVAKAGYIETPSSFSECLYGWPFHLWQIDVLDGKLAIQSKEQENKQLKKLLDYFSSDKSLKKFYYGERGLFYTRYCWQDEPKFSWDSSSGSDRGVASTDSGLEGFNLKKHSQNYGKKTLFKIYFNKLRRRLFSGAKDFELVSLLRCIACAGDLKSDRGGDLSCTNCGRKYGYKDNLPIML